MERVGRVLGLRAATVRERLVVAHVQPLAYARGSYERIRGAFGVKRRVWVAAAFCVKRRFASSRVWVKRRRLRQEAAFASRGVYEPRRDGLGVQFFV